jgi:malate/lactate dehydrogenase
MWPPGPHALAAAAAKAIDAIAGRSRPLTICFVAPDDSEGARARTVALPVRLGARGIEKIVLPSLSVVDRVALDNAMML